MENENKFNFEEYHDPSGDFSNRSLKLASWYIRHKESFKKYLISVLVLFDCIFLSWGIFGLSKYFFYDSIITDKILDSMIVSNLNIEKMRDMYSPDGLVFKDSKIFSSASGKYDLAIKVFNPNNRWLANVTYNFISANGETDSKTEVILPGQERYFIFYGYEASSKPNNFKIQMENIKWQRINEHKVKYVEDYISQRLNFSVENFRFSKNDNDSLFLHFYIINNSIFDFKKTEFNALFFSNNTLISISPVYTNNFTAAERQKIELTSLANISNIDNVKIEPIINVFDSSIFLEY